MKLRLWPRRKSVEPAPEEPATEEPAQPAEPLPAPEAEQLARAIVRPRRPANAFARPYSLGSEEILTPALPEVLPAKVSLTLDEAKTAIRAAGGDVIQVGFLASAYRRHREEGPESAEAAAAHQRLCELIGKRLKDRKLLAPEGIFELLEEAAALKHTD
jgi:hypothetical protein